MPYLIRINFLVFACLLGFAFSSSASEEFCKTPKLKSIVYKINDLDENLYTVLNSDMVLRPERKLEMIASLKVIAKPDQISELDQVIQKKAQALSESALIDVKAAALAIEQSLASGKVLEPKVVERLLEKIQQGSDQVAVSKSPENLKMAEETSFEKLQAQVVQLTASTEYFTAVKAMIQKILFQITKACIGENFSFKAHLADGKPYEFSDCSKVLKNDQTSQKWGGPLAADHCREIIYCNTKEIEGPKKDFFRGFGFEWIVDCKKEQGACQAIEKCVAHVDLGSGTVSSPKGSPNPGVR